MEYLKTEQKGMQSAKVFFNVFNGLSRDCLTYIECKYDLGYKENNNVKKVLSPDMQHFVFEALPSRIILGFNENKSILANMTDLMEEIEYNIGKCNTHEELEIYVVKLLEPFRVLSEHTATIFQHKDFKKRRKGIVGEMMKLGTVENCLHDLYGVMNRFANRLYAILIQRNFDLSSFQDDLEIYIKDGWTASDIAPFVGGMKRANHFVEIHASTNIKQNRVGNNNVEKRQPPKKVCPSVNRKSLEKHFNAKFKGAGNNQNYFEELVSDIQELHTQKDCSSVAKLIYESSGFIKSFSTFASWCRTFYELIGVVVPDKYNFSKYSEPTEALKHKFYYLC